MKKIFFDTETSGLTPGQIGQLSLIIQEDDNEAYGKNYFFQIDSIEEGAAAVTGRNIEFYKEASKGKKFKDCANELLELIKDGVLIGHNVKFDENFLTTEFWRENILFKPTQTFCTMEYFRDIIKIPYKYKSKNLYKNPKLSDLVRYYSIDEHKISDYCEQLFKYTEDLRYHDARYDTTAMFIAFNIYNDSIMGIDSWKRVFTK